MSTLKYAKVFAAFCAFIALITVVKQYRAKYCFDCPRRYIFGKMFTVDLRIGGIGNNMFELMAFLGVARKIGRSPIISRQALTHLKEDHPQFVNLLNGVRVGQHSWLNGFAHFPHSCCSFANPFLHLMDEKYRNYRVIDTYYEYSQSFKYFDSIPRQEVLHMLSVDEETKKIAQSKLVEEQKLKASDHIICVHTRRGDFVASKIHVHSSENFTVPAVKYLVQKVRIDRKSESTLIAVIGQDQAWMKELLPSFGALNSVVVGANYNHSAISEWEFSRRYCDTVLLTASASTFGWWIAYISSGDVYYNTDYGKKGGDNTGFGGTFTPQDFFLPQWTGLSLGKDF